MRWFRSTPGGTPVTAGQQYVLFASSSKDNPGHSGGGSRWGTTNSNTPIVPGQFVFLNYGTDVTQWTTTTWSTIAQDLTITAAFNDVPPLSPVGSPTGTEWAMILIAAGFIVIAFRSLASARAA